MKKLLYTCVPVCCLMLLLCSIVVSAQQHHLHYKLVKGNDTVGEMSVVDIKSYEQRIIQTSLKADVPAVILHFTLTDEKSAVFNSQVLQSAVVTRNLFTGRPDRSITILKNNQYTDGKIPLPAFTYGQVINFSMTMLYTTEPVDKQFVYSEFHQQLVAVEKIGEHIYRIKLPDGQTGEYYYENGICVKIDTKTTWANISTVLVNRKIALK